MSKGRVEDRFAVIELDGIKLITWQELEERMDGLEYQQFVHWMRGQTCHVSGVYVYDVERFINGRRIVVD